MLPAQIEALGKKDPLAFGISYIDLLEGKSWSINDRKWSIEPYQVVNPFQIEKSPLGKARRVVFTKSTQAGISTLSIVKALHFMNYWNVRVMYALPRQKDLSDFSATRFDPIINNSEYLKGRLGTPNSVYTKRIGDSYLFFIEGSVEPRSMPADALFLDELDLCDQDHMGTAVNRLDASAWQLITYLSTPTLPNFAIDAVYQTSDMREWIVPCPHCGFKQPLDWEKNLRVFGAANDPTKVIYACTNCEKELTVTDIQEGAWVPQFPSRSQDLLGYHISQMMTTSAAKMYQHFRDPNQTLSEFYRKRLGRPYTAAGGSIEREDFLINCFDEPYEMEFVSDGRSQYYMGVDQGNQLQLVVGKVAQNRRDLKIVYIELVPFEKGFDRVADLMRLFKVKRAVIDGDPNRHSVKQLQDKFPGRILMADYGEQMMQRFVVKKTGKVSTHVNIDRTEGFDDVVQHIRDGYFSLPGNPAALSPIVETYIDQFTSIKRDVEKRRTASGEEDVAVWRKLRADHLAHATLYLKTAVDVEVGRTFRVAVADGNGRKEEQTVEAEYRPKSDVAEKLTALFAEVPKEQLKEYLLYQNTESYIPPFPLSYKLKRAEDYKAIDITWAIESLIES